MFTLLITLLFALLSFTSASKSLKCERKLEAAVYTPPNYFYDYAKRLEKQFRQFTPIMFTPQNATSVFSFMNTYKITVQVIDAFGYSYGYSNSNTEIAYFKIDNLMSNEVRAMTVGNGFMYRAGSSFALYSFRLFNKDGKYLLITFLIPVVQLYQNDN